MLPAFNPTVVQIIAQQFGVELTHPQRSVWVDNAKAVNIDNPYPEYQPPKGGK